MSLLRKASIVTTPTAYENGKILSVKPVQSLSVEQIENGNFATDTNWTKGAGWTISGGTANATSAATGTPLSQYIDTGKKYKITYDVVSLSQGAFQIDLSYSGTALGQLVTTTGTFTDIVTSINPALSIRVVGTTTGSIDNVSVKELIDADFDFTRNSSATRVNSQGLIEDVQILSGNLVSNGDFSQEGAELITNGDFATDSNWVKSPSGLTISGGSANFTSGQDTYVFQDIMTIGKQYFIELEYNITSLTSSAYFGSNGGSGNAIISMTGLSGSGTLSGYITASATKLIIRSSTFDGSIDNVSVKEVGQDWTVTDSDANNYVVFNGSTARLKFLNTSPITQLRATAPFVSGKKYKLIVDVASVASGSIKVANAGINETFDTIGISTRIINPTGTSNIEFYRASADVDITLNSVKLIEITDDTNLPRIDYTGGEGHWLFEPQSTNLIPYSEDFSQWANQNAGTGSAPIITSNNTISPDGTQNADKVVFNKGAGVSTSDLSVISSNSFTSQTNTVSFYIKADSPQKIVVRNSPTWQLIDVTTEWQRISKTDNGGSVQIGLRDGYGISGVPDTATIYLWGAQSEALSYATSYIPTEGSTKTRLQDICNNAGSSDLINSTEGVLYAEIAALANDGTGRNLGISDGTTNNRILILYSPNSNELRFYLAGSGGSITVNHTLTEVTEFIKVAIKYKAQDFSFYVNGVEVDTNTSNITFSGLDDLSFNNPYGGGTSNLYGNVKSVAVFKEALSDTELQKLTQV